MNRLERRPTQTRRIIAPLRSRSPNWVPLPEILALGISQYSARIFEARRQGIVIENRIETIDGVKRSWFRIPPNAPKPLTPDYWKTTEEQAKRSAAPLFTSRGD